MQPERHALHAAHPREEQGAPGVHAELRAEDGRVGQFIEDAPPRFVGGQRRQDVGGRLLRQARQTEEDAVVVGLRLGRHADAVAQDAEQRQGPGPVDAPAERRLHHQAPVAGVIAEGLDHHHPVRRHHADRVHLALNMGDEGTGRAFVEGVVAAQPGLGFFDRRLIRLRQACCDLAPESADADAELVGPIGVVAVPERHARRRAGGVDHDDPVVVDLGHAPDVAAQQKRVADARFEDELLVKFADARLAVAQIHAERARVRDRADVAHREQARAGQGDQPVGRPIPGDLGPQRRDSRHGRGVEVVAAGEHVEDALELRPGQVAVRIRAADEVEELGRAPRLHRHRCNDLLGEDVERAFGCVGQLDVAVQHAARDRGRLHQVLAEGGVDAAVAGLPDQVARAADALQPLRHALGRLELHDQVDVADVDAELERAGADQGREFAGLQVRLHLAPGFFRHAAVVGADRAFGADGEHAPVAHQAAGRERGGAAGLDLLGALGRELGVEPVSGALGQAPVVGEDQGRTVLEDVAQDLRHDSRPDAAAGQVAEVVHWCDDFELELLLVVRVDDGDRAGRALALLAAEETRGFLERPDGRREADALDRLLRQPCQTFEAER